MTKGVQTAVYVAQGKIEISASPQVYFSTVLGSCVAACLWDNEAAVGGMNHLLLPPDDTTASGEGVHLMELLINGLLKRGAEKHRLRAKLFGGARMIDNLSDIGARNAAFARNFFQFERIDVVSSSLGGDHGRRVKFWPTDGRAKQRFIMDSTPMVEQLPSRGEQTAASGDVDLF
ncbi:MAG: chemotaxis protein CheD [Pseudomonadota bacterium]